MRVLGDQLGGLGRHYVLRSRYTLFLGLDLLRSSNRRECFNLLMN